MSMDPNLGRNENPYAVSHDQAPDRSVIADHSLASKCELLIVLLIVLGVLQIVVGIMELVMGGFFFAYAFFFPQLLAEAAKSNPGQPLPAGFVPGMTAYFGIAGGVTFLSSVMRIVSGSRLFFFKGRILTIISLFFGVLTAATFYCGCTGVPMAIFGLIVMFQSGTAYLFQLAAAGMTPRQIRDHVAMARFQQQQPG